MAQPGDFSYITDGTGQNSIMGPDVATIAGTMLAPAFRYQRWTGALAVVTITVPTELLGGGWFYVIPTGAFTWTAAGNIAVAGTAVVNRILGFFWNPIQAKWNPTYV